MSKIAIGSLTTAECSTLHVNVHKQHNLTMADLEHSRSDCKQMSVIELSTTKTQNKNVYNQCKSK